MSRNEGNRSLSPRAGHWYGAFLYFGNRYGLLGEDAYHKLPSFWLTGYLDSLPPTKEPFIEGLTPALLRLWGFQEQKSTYNKDLYSAAYDSLRRVIQRSWIEKIDDENGRVTERFHVPQYLKYNESESKKILFQGSENEEVFKTQSKERIMQTFRAVVEGQKSEGNIEQLVTNALDFAEKAYARRKPRKSGESYFCHILRTVRYSLDYMTTNNLWGEDNHQRGNNFLDALHVALFHDVIEDVEDLRILPFARKKKDADNEVFQNKDGYTYFLKDKQGIRANEPQLEVSLRAHRSIQALTSPEMDTDAKKFRHVSKESPWFVTEVVKCMDRIDNILTYSFSGKSWGHYLFKMYEAAGGIASLSTMLETAIKFGGAHAKGLDVKTKENLVSPLSGLPLMGVDLAFGMFEAGLFHVREEFLRDLFTRYGYYLKIEPAVLNTLETRKIRTWDDPTLHPNITSTMVDSDVWDTGRSTIEPLSRYEEQCRANAQDIRCGPSRSGYGSHIFVRPISKEDENRTKKRVALLRAGVLSMIPTVFTFGGLVGQQLRGQPETLLPYTLVPLGISTLLTGYTALLYRKSIIESSKTPQ